MALFGYMAGEAKVKSVSTFISASGLDARRPARDAALAPAASAKVAVELEALVVRVCV